MIKEQRKRPRIITFFLRGSLIVFILLLIVSASLLLYLNIKKNEISKELLQAVNKELKGDFSVRSISLGSLYSYPNLQISLNGLKFHAPNGPLTHGELILEVKTLRIKADLSDVLSKKIQIDNVYINDARLFIERDSLKNIIISEGFKPVSSATPAKDSTRLYIFIKNILIEDSEVLIVDRPTKVILPFRLNQVKGTFKLKNDLIQGQANLDLLPLDFYKTEAFLIDVLPIQITAEYSVNIKKELVKVKGKEFYIGDEHYSLNYHYDYTDRPYMDFQMTSLDTGVDLSTLFLQKVDTLEDDNRIKFLGQAHFRTDLYWKPDSKSPFFVALEARFNLEGKNLKIYGIDLDDVIEKFKRSQKFNLADVGAVMFAGPAGLAVTKGTDFARLAFTKAGDSTEVKHFVSDWKMKNGVLTADDLALSTDKNLIATSGLYKIQNDSLDFNIVILDKRGCELVGQRIYGDAINPEYGKVKLIKTLLGPVTNFFRNVGVAKCDTIYKGKVIHPAN
jgi:hypothetical protein